MKKIKNIIGLNLWKLEEFNIFLSGNDNNKDNDFIVIDGVSGAGKTSILKGLLLALMPRLDYSIKIDSNNKVLQYLNKTETNGHEGENLIKEFFNEMFTNIDKSYFGFTINDEEFILMYIDSRSELKFNKIPIKADISKIHTELKKILSNNSLNLNVEEAIKFLIKKGLIDTDREQYELDRKSLKDFYTITGKNKNRYTIIDTKGNKEQFEAILLIMLENMGDSTKGVNLSLEAALIENIKKKNKELIKKNNREDKIYLKSEIEYVFSNLERLKSKKIFSNIEIIQIKEKIEKDLNIFTNKIENFNYYYSIYKDLNEEDFFDKLKKLKENYEENNKDSIVLEKEENNLKLKIQEKNVLLKDKNKFQSDFIILKEYIKNKYINLEENFLSDLLLKNKKEIKDINENLKDIQNKEETLKKIKFKIKNEKLQLKILNETFNSNKKKINDLNFKLKNEKNKSYLKDLELTDSSKAILKIFEISENTELNIKEKNKLNEISKSFNELSIFKRNIDLIIINEINEVKEYNEFEIKEEIKFYENKLKDNQKNIENSNNTLNQYNKNLIDFNSGELNKEKLEIKKNLLKIESDKIEDFQYKNKRLKENEEEILILTNNIKNFVLEIEKILIKKENLKNIEKSLNLQIQILEKDIEIIDKNNILFNKHNLIIEDFSLFENNLNDLEEDYFKFNYENLIDELLNLKNILENNVLILLNKLNGLINIDLIDLTLLNKVEKINELLNKINIEIETSENELSSLESKVSNIVELIIGLENLKSNQIKILDKIINPMKNIKTLEGGYVDITYTLNLNFINYVKILLDFFNKIDEDDNLTNYNIKDFKYIEQKLYLLDNIYLNEINSGLINDNSIFINSIKAKLKGSTGNTKVVETKLRIKILNEFQNENNLLLPILIDEAGAMDNDLLNQLIEALDYDGSVLLMAAKGVTADKEISSIVSFIKRGNNDKFLINQLKQKNNELFYE